MPGQEGGDAYEQSYGSDDDGQEAGPADRRKMDETSEVGRLKP